MSATHGWLAPASAWRLTQCSASAAFAAAPVAPASGPVTNAGSAAHAAVALWIQGGLWQRPEPHLQRLYDDVCGASGIEPESVLNGRLTRARLGARELQLRSLLHAAGPDPEISCEAAVADPARRLWGVPDVVVRGATTLVLDLKTGADATSPLPARIRDQLLIYAHLVSVADGRMPARVAVFSLAKGAIDADLNLADIDRLLASIEAARASQPEPRPSPDGCRYCTRRFGCEPHWEAVSLWEKPDGVEGTVLRVESADSGAMSVQMETPAGPVWLTHLSPTMVTGDLAPGDTARAIRVIPPRSSPPTWRATRETLLAVTCRGT